MPNNTAVEPPVLNISGGRPLTTKKPKQNETEVQSVPKFEYKEFPSILSGILFKSDHPEITKLVDHDKKCLAVMCVTNNRAKVRLYHMYCTTEKEIWNDNHKIELLYYKDMPDIQQKRHHLIVDTFFPESLLQRAVQHFSKYKWNKDGNVLETPMSATDENVILRKLKELRIDKEEDQRLLNYIKFLKMSEI